MHLLLKPAFEVDEVRDNMLRKKLLSYARK